MIVSTKGRYALRVMIDLAEHQSEKYSGDHADLSRHPPVRRSRRSIWKTSSRCWCRTAFWRACAARAAATA